MRGPPDRAGPRGGRPDRRGVRRRPRRLGRGRADRPAVGLARFPLGIRDYITPFLVTLSNDAAVPVQYEPEARLEGFVYFPRLRGAARQLSMEFHHRLGEVPRVLTLTFEVQRDGSDAPRG